MKLKCDVCGEPFYSQTDCHEMGEPNVCSEACAWEISHTEGEPKPPKVEQEIFYATVEEFEPYQHGELYETSFEHGHYRSVVFTATPFKRCLVRIVIEKMRDLKEDE